MIKNNFFYNEQVGLGFRISDHRDSREYLQFEEGGGGLDSPD